MVSLDTLGSLCLRNFMIVFSLSTLIYSQASASVIVNSNAEVILKVTSVTDQYNVSLTDYSFLNISASFVSSEQQTASAGASGSASAIVTTFSDNQGDLVDANNLQVGQGLHILSQASGSAPDNAMFDFSSQGDWFVNITNTGALQDVARIRLEWAYTLGTSISGDLPTGNKLNTLGDYGLAIATADDLNVSGTGGYGGSATEVRSGFGVVPLIFPDFVSNSVIYNINLDGGSGFSTSKPVDVSAFGRSAQVATSVPAPPTMVLVLTGLLGLLRKPLIQRGRHGQAADIFESLLSRYGRHPSYVGGLAYALAAGGKDALARKLLSKMEATRVE